MADLPELKTWRYLLAAEVALEGAAAAAVAEDIEGLVGRSVREARLFLAAALVTLEEL